MLFKRRFLEGIRDGSVTLAFRRWKRPTVREGGALLTAAGRLEIGSVDPVSVESITAEDARNAGYGSLRALLAELNRRGEGRVYRIRLGPLRPDPRIALRESPAAGEELDSLRAGLRRIDSRATSGPWTTRVLEVIEQNPGTRAADLCARVGQEKGPFKRNVRKLKNLGLTESLGVGYRLSPRGSSLLKDLRSGR